MDDEGKADAKEFQTPKRAPIETGISRGNDSVHRQFGRFGAPEIPVDSGAGRGRGGLPMRLFHSVNLEESPSESASGQGRGGPHNRRPRHVDTEESGMGRSRWGPPHRRLPEYLRRSSHASGAGRGSGSSDRRQLLQEIFGDDFLFECILHRFTCPLQSRRDFFEWGGRGGPYPYNRNSSESTPRKETPPTKPAEPVVIPKKTIPVDGKKIALVITYDRDPISPSCTRIEDSGLMVKTLRDLGFKIEDGSIPEEEDSSVSEDEESDDDMYSKKPQKKCLMYDEIVILNQYPRHTVDLLEKLIKEKTEATCFLLYFIAKQLRGTLRTEDNRVIPMHTILRPFEGIGIPVVVIIQAFLSDEVEPCTVLMNIDGFERVIPHNIPRNTNIVLGYFPDRGSRKESVAKIVSEELCSKYDINTVLTNVMDRVSLEEGSCKISPKFSSTLTKPFCLAEGIEIIKGQEPKSYSREGRYLAYAFLFSEFDKSLMVPDLNDIREEDEKSLMILKDLGVELEFCVVDGMMGKKQFQSKLEEILQSEDMDSCACFMIILSTHGCSNLKIFAHDDIFQLDKDVWQKLAACEKLNNKPKIIITDVCRKFYIEGRVFYEKPNYDLRYCRPYPPAGLTMCDLEEKRMPDTVIALATTKGKKALASSGKTMFIDKLCQKMKTSCKEDFLTILTATMADIVEQDEDEEEKQQVIFTSSLQKLLYLPEKNQEEPEKKLEEPEKKQEEPEKRQEETEKMQEEPEKTQEEPEKTQEEPEKKPEEPEKKPEDPEKSMEVQ